MTAVPNLRLQLGDVLQVVGREETIRKAAELLGNSVKALNETHFVPLFAGIVVGTAARHTPWQSRLCPNRCGWVWPAAP